MTGEFGAEDDHHPTLDAIQHRLQRASTILAVQAWRSANVQRRGELSSLAGRIRVVVDQYEQRRSTGVRSVDAANYLERLRRNLAATTNCESRRICLAFASDAEELSNEGALVLGLITSELVTRALARADANAPRAVRVRFGQETSGHVLTVREEHRASGRKAVLTGADSVGMELIRQLVRNLKGTLVTADNGAGVNVRLSLGGSDLASPLRNISPRPSPDQPRAAFSPKEDLHEFPHS